MTLKRFLLLVAVVFATLFVAALLMYVYGLAREVHMITGMFPGI